MGLEGNSSKKEKRSFEIHLDSGGMTMRSKRFIRHEHVSSNKRVSFAQDRDMDPTMNEEQPGGTESAESKESKAPLARSWTARHQVRNV